MSEQPRYRLQRGRPMGHLTAPPTRMTHLPLPIHLFENVYDDCRDADVAMGLSESGSQAYISDYMRAAILLFHRLLQGPSRARVIAFSNLPESRVEEVLTHLEFVYAALPDTSDKPRVLGVPEHPGIDSALHARMHMRAEGVEGKPDPKKAPLKERDPWNKL